MGAGHPVAPVRYQSSFESLEEDEADTSREMAHTLHEISATVQRDEGQMAWLPSASITVPPSSRAIAEHLRRREVLSNLRGQDRHEL